MITRFNHAQLTVPRGQSDAVRAFFGQVLGLPEIPVPDTMTKYGLIWFRVGPQDELHVGQEDNIDRTKTMAHLAFEVTDVKAWREKLSAAGVELIDQPLIDGYDRFHFRDPFGNRLEIIGRTATGG